MYEKRGKAAPSSKWSGASFFRAPRTQCTEARRIATDSRCWTKDRISSFNIVTSGTRNISKRWSTWKNFNRISGTNIVTSGTRYISKRWSISKNFNRISCANIVTSGTRNISKAWSTSKNFQLQFSRQYRDKRHSLHFQSLVDFKNFNRISRAFIVTSASRNISKRWPTWKNFNSISRANIVTSCTRNISKAWSTSKNFNRISCANIVTSDTRNISKAWSTSKNFQSHFSRQYRDWRHSQHPKLGRLEKLSIAFLAPISWLAPLATSPNVGRLEKISKISVAFLAPISWLAPLATSPNVGRLQKISIASPAPISWLAALASSSMVFQIFFQSHIRLLNKAPAIGKIYGDKW